MGLEVIDGVDGCLLGGGIACLAGGVEIAEDVIELAGIGLLEEGVELVDQLWNGGLFVHRLVRKRTEF